MSGKFYPINPLSYLLFICFPDRKRLASLSKRKVHSGLLCGFSSPEGVSEAGVRAIQSAIVMATAGACGRHSARCYLGGAVMADSNLE